MARTVSVLPRRLARRHETPSDDRPLYSTVRLLADGSVIVYKGTSDMGQGAPTVFARIAPEELGAPLEWIAVVTEACDVLPR